MKNFVNNFYKNTHNIYKALLVIVSIVAIVYLFPSEGKFKYEYKKNKPWQYATLYAPFDFSVMKTQEEINAEKDSVKQNSPLFFDVKKINNKDLKLIVQNEIKNTDFSDLDKKRVINYFNRLIDKIYATGLTEAYSKEKKDRKVYLIKGNKAIETTFDKIYTKRDIENLIKKDFQDNKELSDFMLQIVAHLPPNLSPNNKLYSEELQNRLSEISTHKGMITKGTAIVHKGELVTDETYRKLYSLEESFSSNTLNFKSLLWIYIGYSILVAIVLTMLLLFFKKYRPEIYEDNKKIGLILFNMILMVVLTTFTIRYDPSYIFVVPLAILPLILKAFFDSRVGLFVHVLTVLLLGFVVPNSFEFVFLQIMAGIVTILTVSELTKRSNLFTSVGNIILIYILGYFAFHLIHEGSFEMLSIQTFVLFFLNGILTIALSHQLILLYEKLFGLVSDVSLLEWSNTNSKLLKRLADKAPGTFNHSMQVAHLAEAAANEINANALLVRAGALYHDIGKMLNPFYFTENQTSGVNHHDDLEPEESAKIIINHVLDGVEMARKNNLPDRLIDFIRTHHGTGLVKYFYNKAKEKDPEVDKEKFRYPGPNPFSKETAILMMADSVEAASKSLREPTAEKIDEFVDKIIDAQLREGLFDNANITLKEISQIKKLLKKKLKNIYHLRVEYPE